VSHGSSDLEGVASSVRDAVLAVPGVARLTPGTPVEVATRFPGGKVIGVRLGDSVEVHVAVDRAPIGPLADQVRTAVQAVLRHTGDRRPVDIVVDDIDPAAFAAAVPRR
jgi:hypothetical protein